MPSAITPLANITLTSAAATVSFSSISGLFRDLILVSSLYPNTANQQALVRFNSDSGANYNGVTMNGNGSTTSSGAPAGSTSILLSYHHYLSTTAFMTSRLEILEYAISTKQKQVLVRQNLASTFVGADAWRWLNTAAITSIQFSLASGSFVAGSSFALYGVSA